MQKAVQASQPERLLTLFQALDLHRNPLQEVTDAFQD